MNYIGLDIGTTTICAVCLDEEGHLLYSNTLQNSSNIEGKAFEALQSPHDILDSCRQLIAEIIGQFNAIAAIGISNQMHGILYIDKSGTALSPLFTWQDERGNLYHEAEETYCRRLSRITGYPMATGYGLTTHYYNSINSCIPDGAVKLCTIGDYIAMQLCGTNAPRIHPSNAASLGLFNIKTKQFDAAALKKANIDTEILPDITSVEEIIGITDSGIPVRTAIGDNQASVFGSLSSNSDIHINIGTSSQISIVTDNIATSASLECRPYLLDKYLLVGAPLCGGYSYRILKDFFAEAAVMLGINELDSIYEKMNEAGLEAYSSNVEGLSFDTRFRGTRNEPQLRASVTGISPSNFKPGNLIVALLRGICEELHECFSSIPNVQEKKGPICASGNGVRLNPLMPRLLEDTFGRSIIIPDSREDASTGAAKAAMLALK
ncbi:MAG: sedoheptulokinase [Pseudomonadota bacterium]